METTSLIAGQGGTGGRYPGVSAQQGDAYRVVRYDRRCCGRSTGHKTHPMDLTQQARDVPAVVQALGETQGVEFDRKIDQLYKTKALIATKGEPVRTPITRGRRTSLAGASVARFERFRATTSRASSIPSDLRLNAATFSSVS